MIWMIKQVCASHVANLPEFETQNSIFFAPQDAISLNLPKILATNRAFFNVVYLAMHHARQFFFRPHGLWRVVFIPERDVPD